MPNITVKIGGEDWSISTCKLDGYYGLCCYDDRTIGIHHRLRGLSLLDTTIHEVMHAQFPKMSEREVAIRATEIADALWGMGWRKQPTGKR